MRFLNVTATFALIMSAGVVSAAETASDETVAAQRAALAAATEGAGFGPQSPRDIDVPVGLNKNAFRGAPNYSEMHLCNIHFHEGAEHKGGEFTKYAGNGDGKGHGTGYLYNGTLTDAELTPVSAKIGESEYDSLEPGDTIEIHYVHTTAQIEPGATLGSCLNENIANPQLRVEAQVYVLVNDGNALDFNELTKVEMVDGFHQAVNIPTNTGTPIQYTGSTTGPSYNEKGSPLQVSWSVRPKVAKVNIMTVAAWLENNIFEESYAHGVRNLVENKKLLSVIGQ